MELKSVKMSYNWRFETNPSKATIQVFYYLNSYYFKTYERIVYTIVFAVIISFKIVLALYNG